MTYDNLDYFTFFEEQDRQQYIRSLEKENAELKARLNRLMNIKQENNLTKYIKRIDALEAENKTLISALKKTYDDSVIASQKNNNDVKAYATLKGVRLWMVAEKLGISEFTLSRILRGELDDDEKVRILGVIDGISAEEAI